MNRLGQIDPATAPVGGPARQIFDGPLKGKHFNLFKSMANSPAALNAYLGMSGALAHGVLSAGEREAVQLAIAESNACAYCAAAHTAIGKMTGLTEAQTLEARRGVMGNPRMNALLRFTLALHEKKGHISDADWNAFKAAGFAEAHAAEVAANYALAIFTNYFNHMNDTVVDFPAAPRL